MVFLEHEGRFLGKLALRPLRLSAKLRAVTMAT